MTYQHYLGLDLGQAQDYSALCVVEEPLWLPEGLADEYHAPAGWIAPSALPSPTVVDRVRTQNYRDGRPGLPPLTVPHLERFALGTPYPAIVAYVARLLQTAPLRPELTALVVDATGVGRPVVDLFEQAGLRPIAVTISAGQTVTVVAPDALRCPKRDLVSAVAVLLEQRRLQIAAALPDAPILRRELEAFRRKLTPVGHDSYASWRESDHDDLVLSVALACWYRAWWCAHMDLANTHPTMRRTG